MFHRPDYFPNASDMTRRIYYVAGNHPYACDDNPGTERLPFKTISRAAALADMYDRVLIDEGVYREEVHLLRNGHMYEPGGTIRFEAMPVKKVYLRGSDVFDPEWEHLGGGVYKALLPDFLFKKGAYNPFALSAEVDNAHVVRPTHGAQLPETLGQVYVNGLALEQLDSLETVLLRPGSFIVPGEGRHAIAHFPRGVTPGRALVEISVRERCLKPLFTGTVFIETLGIVIEHAANPGPFCHGRALSLRHTSGPGILVRKTFAFPSTVKSCANLLYPAYTRREGHKVIGAITDDLGRGPQREAPIYTVLSEDAGRTWLPTGEMMHLNRESAPCYFLDTRCDRLLRHYRRYERFDVSGAFGACDHETVFQVSHDGGASWDEPVAVGRGDFSFGMLPLADGRILWPYSVNTADVGMHQSMRTRIGTWRSDGGIDWAAGGGIDVTPEESTHGVAEPHMAQFDDGRVFAILRQGNVRPSQDRAGVPSVKLWSVSEDGGGSWSKPEPLRYEDGHYVYSPRSFPDVFRSSKNGRFYVLLNITGTSAENCDPRTALHIAELDPATCRLRRQTVAVVEQKHPEHHPLVRYSNWASFQDRATGNPVLFMKLALSEHCPIRFGYDYNYYRYEIVLPDSDDSPQ